MIIIRTVGNPALYQSLQDSIASETRHRTVSGAMRRLAALRRQTASWANNMGRWGTIQIEVNGRLLTDDDGLGTILEATETVRSAYYDQADADARAARYLADALAA